MKIMIAGGWRWPQYEAAMAEGLRSLGVEVIEFNDQVHFSSRLGRLSLAIPALSPHSIAMNIALKRAARQTRPDHILFWRPTHIVPSTLRALSAQGIGLASYNNDDPFSPRIALLHKWYQRNLWRLYEKCLPLFDVNLFFRQINCDEAKARGVDHAEVLLPYFLPWQHHVTELNDTEKQQFSAEIVFVGHFEDDGRDHDINALRQLGLDAKVWGDETWEGSALKSRELIRPALGASYTKALGGAKICLCYLSKLNRDTYTRRNFEIPAVGRVMLTERTVDLMAMFEEDEEACFFSSREELVRKARWLLDHPEARERIAAAGMRRVWADGHDVNNRARQLIGFLESTALRGGMRMDVKVVK